MEASRPSGRSGLELRRNPSTAPSALLRVPNDPRLTHADSKGVLPPGLQNASSDVSGRERRGTIRPFSAQVSLSQVTCPGRGVEHL